MLQTNITSQTSPNALCSGLLESSVQMRRWTYDFSIKLNVHRHDPIWSKAIGQLDWFVALNLSEAKSAMIAVSLNMFWIFQLDRIGQPNPFCSDWVLSSDVSSHEFKYCYTTPDSFYPGQPGSACIRSLRNILTILKFLTSTPDLPSQSTSTV